MNAHIARKNLLLVHGRILEEEHPPFFEIIVRVGPEALLLLPRLLCSRGGYIRTRRCAIIVGASCCLDRRLNSPLLAAKLVLGGAETGYALICRSQREKSAEMLGTR